jgi:hypothetical protein
MIDESKKRESEGNGFVFAYLFLHPIIWDGGFALRPCSGFKADRPYRCIILLSNQFGENGFVSAFSYSSYYQPHVETTGVSTYLLQNRFGEEAMGLSVFSCCIKGIAEATLY